MTADLPNLNDELKKRLGSRGTGHLGRGFDAGITSAMQNNQEVVLAHARKAQSEINQCRNSLPKEDRNEHDSDGCDYCSRNIGARDALLQLDPSITLEELR